MDRTNKISIESSPCSISFFTRDCYNSSFMTEVVFIPVNRAEFARQRAALAAEQRDRRYQPWLAIFNDALAKFRAAIASDASCPISISPLHYDVLRIGQEKIGIHRELVFDPDEKRHHNQNRGYRLSVSIDLESGSKRHD